MRKDLSSGLTGSSAQAQRDLPGKLGRLGHLPHPATAAPRPTKFTGRIHIDAPPPPYTASQLEPAGKATISMADVSRSGNYDYDYDQDWDPSGFAASNNGDPPDLEAGPLALRLEGEGEGEGSTGSDRVRSILADFYAFALKFADDIVRGTLVLIIAGLSRFFRSVVRLLKTLFFTVVGLVLLFIFFPPSRQIVAAWATPSSSSSLKAVNSTNSSIGWLASHFAFHKHCKLEGHWVCGRTRSAVLLDFNK